MANARREALPSEFDPRRLVRRAAQIGAILLVVLLVAFLTPGLGEFQDRLQQASIGWLVVAVLLELGSGFSYILMFRPIFSPHMPWRGANELGWSELAMGSIVPASGIGGLALGAWVLNHEGIEPDTIAKRSVAFFLIKSMVNFVAVFVVGIVMWAGVGPEEETWLTLGPAVLAIVVIAIAASIPRIGPGNAVDEDAPKRSRAISHARHALVDGAGEALRIVRTWNPAVLAGTLGYWAFDNAVLWATFKAFGESPAITVILMGYLIGQLGGLLPIPGGIGGIDGGLIGCLILYGAPAAAAGAAVLAYRVILFWLPLLIGAFAFAALRKDLDDPEHDVLAEVPE